MPCVDRQCAAVGLPNLWASSVMASSSSMLKDGRSVNEVVSAAAGRGDLDVVGALLDELARHGAGLVRAGHLGAEVAHVAADDGYGASAQVHSRADGQSVVYGVAETEHGHVLRAVLTNRGDAGEEGLAGVPSGLDGQDFVGVGGDLVADPPVAEAHVVGMRVDHAGHQGLVGIVEGLDGSAVGRGHFTLPADGDDIRSLDENRAGGDGWAASSVDECAGVYEFELSVGLSHVVLPRLPFSRPMHEPSVVPIIAYGVRDITITRVMRNVRIPSLVKRKLQVPATPNTDDPGGCSAFLPLACCHSVTAMNSVHQGANSITWVMGA